LKHLKEFKTMSKKDTKEFNVKYAIQNVKL